MGGWGDFYALRRNLQNASPNNVSAILCLQEDELLATIGAAKYIDMHAEAVQLIAVKGITDKVWTNPPTCTNTRMNLVTTCKRPAKAFNKV
eukprot:1028062-Amphidinium_carterae.1